MTVQQRAAMRSSGSSGTLYFFTVELVAKQGENALCTFLSFSYFSRARYFSKKKTINTLPSVFANNMQDLRKGKRGREVIPHTSPLSK